MDSRAPSTATDWERATEHTLREATTEGAHAWSSYVEPSLLATARYTGIPILLLSTVLLVFTYRIARRVLRLGTQVAIGLAIALGTAYVRGALR